MSVKENPDKKKRSNSNLVDLRVIGTDGGKAIYNAILDECDCLIVIVIVWNM